MEKKGFLINASNLHVGGGVQVASSFIHELSTLEFSSEFSLLVSAEVYENLLAVGCRLCRFKDVRVLDVQGLGALWSGLGRVLNGYSVVFTIFGPLYVFRQRFVSIVGFAQAWIIYPENEAESRSSFVGRLLARLKFSIQSFFYSRADRLIVEAPHVKSRLCSLGIGKEEFIDVVPNCVSSVFLDPPLWRELQDFRRGRACCIGFVGRDYPHKNISVLPLVRKILRFRYGFEVDFFVTFTQDEWLARSPDFREEVFNVGPLKVAECPSFYRMLDAVIFPSLLECFSVTPLETMVMERPLFASDRPFVRDVCSDYAFYFDPLDPESIAKVIYDYFGNNKEGDSERLARARRHALLFSNAKDRAERYVEIVKGVWGC